MCSSALSFRMIASLYYRRVLVDNTLHFLYGKTAFHLSLTLHLRDCTSDLGIVETTAGIRLRGTLISSTNVSAPILTASSRSSNGPSIPAQISVHPHTPRSSTPDGLEVLVIRARHIWSAHPTTRT